MIASAMVATLALSAGPALAAQHGHSGGARSSGGAHVQASRQVAAAPVRSSAPVRSVAQAAPRAVSPQAAARPVYPQRAYGAVRTVGNPVIVGQAVGRPGYGSYAVAGRPVVGGGYGYGRYGYGYGGGFAFAQPYFSFRPRFNLGFGLFVGYPVAFPYGYYYNPYDYGYGYPVYGMAQPVPTDPGNGSYGAPTNTANYGGVTFDIQPAEAAVFVDGKYIGTVAEFSPQQPPLSLTLGRHHVDLRAQGFQTLSFDLDVVAGQVTPYQGAMTVVK